jgi:Ca2+-transporting ATPase
MTADPVTIEKNGNLITVDEKDLAIGDVVVLQTGDEVPADLKLIQAQGLEVDAFELTGELLPVLKTVHDENPTIFQGSRVVKGSGKGIVKAVGTQTEFGKISQQQVTKPTEDQLKLIEKQDAWWLLFTLPLLPLVIACTGRILLGLLIYLLTIAVLILVKHHDFQQRLLTFLYGKPLERAGIKIRIWSAFRRCKDINLVCFDKTGVLTTRETEVSRLAFFGVMIEASDGLKDLDDFTSDMVVKACALCHDTWFYERIETGHPLDRAMIHFAQQQGANLNHMLQAYVRIYDQPFTSESRHMICGYDHAEEGKVYLMKGDPNIVQTRCRFYTTLDGQTKRIGADFLKGYRNIVNESDRSGHKTITLAYACDDSAMESNGFTVLCVLQFENTLQPGLRNVIQYISDRGIRSIILTGDSPESAIWAAEESGIGKDDQGYLTGSMLDRMSFDEIKRQMQHCAIFCRLSPSQKGLLVRLLQNKHTKVAMVGDGFNDGIALKVADVGISFLKGSSATARRFSEILINDIQDLIGVLKQAHLFKRASVWLSVIRVVMIVVVYAAIYGWSWWYLLNVVR